MTKLLSGFAKPKAPSSVAPIASASPCDGRATRARRSVRNHRATAARFIRCQDQKPRYAKGIVIASCAVMNSCRATSASAFAQIARGAIPGARATAVWKSGSDDRLPAGRPMPLSDRPPQGRAISVLRRSKPGWKPLLRNASSRMLYGRAAEARKAGQRRRPL